MPFEIRIWIDTTNKQEVWTFLPHLERTAAKDRSCGVLGFAGEAQLFNMYSLVLVVRIRLRSRKLVTLLSITNMFHTSLKGFFPAP